uniref:DNA-directed RNA polymerase subunit beta n=1 Tax=Neotessella volvocina TaxID=52559 RepID=A0A3G2QZU6_9STRA|nr:RNA polymerase beta subunit [Neotessella volvocina]
MNKIFVNNLGDLSEIQRASFYRFLLYGISEELATFPNPFLTKLKLPKTRKKNVGFVFLYTNNVKLKGPMSLLEDCFHRDSTYAIQFYVPSEYSYLEIEKKRFKKEENTKTKKIIRVKQDIFFGEIPLMTEEGTFVINGCERIVISQIIRSPGIYFRKEYGLNRKTLYTATVISNKGLWTKFILDSHPEIDMDRIFLKLTDFRLKTLEIKKKDQDSDLQKLFIFDLIRYFGFSLEEISDSLKYSLHLGHLQLTGYCDSTEQQDIYDIENFYLIKKIFYNQRSGCFSIGEIGRYKINKKLGINLPKDITYLTIYDFIGIIDGLIELKYYDRINDDIDHIKNKQLRSIGELLQNQIRIGLYRIQKSLLEDIKAIPTQKFLFDFDPYFNPEEWMLDPRPITAGFKEFFQTSQLSQFMDQINPLSEMTHKRRISVFGPNGLKRDHISTVIRDIHPSQYGRICPIETSEGQNAGLIMSLTLLGRVGTLGSLETPYFFMEKSHVFSDKSTIFLDPEQESDIKVAFCDISLTKEKKVLSSYLSVKDNYFFSAEKINEINFITTSPLQVVSLATALIPFLEHNDANRALMGSNMQRQAVPLLYPQKPIIGTGLETIAILDCGMVIKTYSQGQVVFSSASHIEIKDFSGQQITYFLRKYVRSNQETSLNQRPIVWSGEQVFSGQIIADGPGTNDGELALGRNLTVAYMPWEGYNYEDAIIINERIILEDCLTSIHIEEYETELNYSIIGIEKITRELNNLTKYVRRHLNNEGIVNIGSYVKEHDLLVGKLTPCEEDPSPEANLLRALYGKKTENFKDTSLRVSQGTEGRVIDVRVLPSLFLGKDELSPSSETIRIYIAQKRKIVIGDKLSGRHGNKGIVSRILSRQDMPYLPDGTPIDIIFNPLGVPSRMNVGQIFESLLGLAGEKLGKRFKILPFDEVYEKEASRILVNQKLKEAAKIPSYSWIYNEFYPGKILLRDGRTGEYFDNPITVGKSYILKLIHLVEDKIHARATGPYSMITEQPLSGKAQNGGQRFGEMEVWALEAYGCSNILQELLTIKSDDIDGRNDMYESILVRKEIDKPNPSIPESFLALIRELHALGLDFSIRKFEGGFEYTTDTTQIEKDIFKDMENRLKLRALLARKKAEQFATTITAKLDIEIKRKLEEKAKLLNLFKQNNSLLKK